MGTGTNVQKRLVALHHLDAPWKPAEVEQREGRILRQGNGNEEVAIYRYVTEGSFDAYMWQALETKARFIGQVMTGRIAVRRAEDIGGQELSYAEVKAIASGNPAVLTLAEADAEIQKLAVLQEEPRRRAVPRPPQHPRPAGARSPGCTSALDGLSADRATAAAHQGQEFAHRRTVLQSQRGRRSLVHRLKSLPEKVQETRRVSLGTYRGLTFGIVLHRFGAPDAYLEGEADASRHALTRCPRPAGGLQRPRPRLAGGYDGQVATAARSWPSPRASCATTRPASASRSPMTPTSPS